MLVSKYPISKEEALKYNAKEINITNNSTCDTAYYKVTIKDLVNSSINKDKINYQVIDKSTNTETIDKNPDNFNISDSLTKGNTKTYTIRLWIDESATNTDLFINGDTTKPMEYRYALNIESSDEYMKVDYALTFAKSKVGTDGLEIVTHEIDDTLQVDNKFATEYRYRGGDSIVNNYVTFNNETWRIIGIIPTEDTDGNVENRFKIIKDESIGYYVWDSDTEITYDYEINNNFNLLNNNNNDIITPNDLINHNEKYETIQTAPDLGTKKCTTCSNNWARPSALNTYLNSTYYNSINTNSKNMIGTTKYYLGGYNTSDITNDVMWQYERKNDVNRSGYYSDTNPVMSNDASKSIALMYASDYGYGASKECPQTLNNYKNDTLCKMTNNWLDKSLKEWLLPQYPDGGRLFYLESSNVEHYNGWTLTYYSFAVRPILSLSSNVKISGGEGTSSNPYTLSQ